jgi:hypothetical protein
MLSLPRIARTILAPALVATAIPAVADAQLTKAGVVTTLQGTATVARASVSRPMPLRFKDEVFVQDRITTGNDSIARILLGGKAIVTVRERSVLTITEVPGTSTLDLGIGKIALAVVKERMRSGETIEIRTPNAVAGIRGTVVITEVDQTTAQLAPGRGAFTSRFTVLQGVISVSQYNPLTRQLGPTVNLGTLQTTGITGSAAPRPPVTITPEAAKQLASEYKTTIKEAPPAAAASGIVNSQVQQAASYVTSVLAPAQQTAAAAPTERASASQGAGTEGGQGGAQGSAENQASTGSAARGGSGTAAGGTAGGPVPGSGGSGGGGGTSSGTTGTVAAPSVAPPTTSGALGNTAVTAPVSVPSTPTPTPTTASASPVAPTPQPAAAPPKPTVTTPSPTVSAPVSAPVPTVAAPPPVAPPVKSTPSAAVSQITSALKGAGSVPTQILSAPRQENLLKGDDIRHGNERKKEKRNRKD